MIFNKGVDLFAILKEQGGPAGNVAFLQSLPLQAIVIPFFVFVMFISQATGVDVLLPSPWQTWLAMKCRTE
jgi:hypothetical protein